MNLVFGFFLSCAPASFGIELLSATSTYRLGSASSNGFPASILARRQAVAVDPRVAWTRRSALLMAFGICSPAFAASNRYDFGYTLQKSLDPTFYGPATGDIYVESNPVEDKLLKDIGDALAVLSPLPALTKEGKWKQANALLSQSSVVPLWKGPEEQNPIRVLAIEKDSYTINLSDRLLILADVVSGALRQVDDFMHSNTNEDSPPFSKKPQEASKNAIGAIQEVMRIAPIPYGR